MMTTTEKREAARNLQPQDPVWFDGSLAVVANVAPNDELTIIVLTDNETRLIAENADWQSLVF